MYYGIYLGKFNPMHKSHAHTIKHMINTYGYENCLTLIGSANSHLFDDRMHWFNYEERFKILKTEFPNLKIAPIPDMRNLNMWFIAIWNIIHLWKSDSNKTNTVFFTGKEDDVSFLIDNNYLIEVIPREVTGISATEVRENLNKNKSIEHLVTSQTHDLILQYYNRENDGKK